MVSPNGVYRCLRRHGLSTRKARLGLVAGYQAPPEPERSPEVERHLDAPRPGAMVQLDCLYVGRLHGTKGSVWQHTAIDVHSGFCWAELESAQRGVSSSRRTSAIARRVAADLARWGWQLEPAVVGRG